MINLHVIVSILISALQSEEEPNQSGDDTHDDDTEEEEEAEEEEEMSFAERMAIQRRAAIEAQHEFDPQSLKGKARPKKRENRNRRVFLPLANKTCA